MAALLSTLSLNSGTSAFHLVFYAAAFKDKVLFHEQIRAFKERLHKYHPFNVLAGVDIFSVITLFDPEANPANTTSITSAGIGLLLNKTSGRVEMDPPIFLKKVENLHINAISNEHNLGQVLKNIDRKMLQCLLVVLLPPQGGGGFENEYERTDSDGFYLVATSCDGHWEQVVLRSMGRLMGLGDEFENAEPKYEQPEKYIGKMIDSFFPNLLYSTTTFSSVPSADTKWHKLNNKIGFDFPIRRAPGHPQQADRSIPAHNFIPKNIELWEGGAGYRTQIYRSAHDCLMRRQIGNKNLPVRDSVVPLCPACSAYMLQQILAWGRENRVPSLEFRGFIQQL